MKKKRQKRQKAIRRHNKAFLVIDMLNDFVRRGAPLFVPGAQSIVPNIKRRMDEARDQGIPIIYLCDAHKPKDPEFRVWPSHAVKGSKGAQVVDGLTPQKGDIVIPKTTYSGFYGTRLEEILKKMRVKQLIITGVCTEICVLYTTADAYMRGYTVEVPEDCCAALTPDNHRFALVQMTRVLKPAQH